MAIAGRWSHGARLSIKMIALVVLAGTVLGIGYQLLKRAELSAISTVLTFLMLAVEAFIGWVAWQQLKGEKSPHGQQD